MERKEANNEEFMRRCLFLASLGAGNVAPNPLVGAVLVFNGKIIGEGFHEKYGGPHAEVNCLASVTSENRASISESTLFVSLEPCSHFGKTPPCASLILEYKIPKVVVGCMDPFAAVAGNGIKMLRENGVEVVVGVLEEECRILNRMFFTFHEKRRPYILLKWAQSADGKIASDSEQRTFISSDISNRLVHQLRNEYASILVGKNTALQDNPSLTVRLWKGKNPVRIVMDRRGDVPLSHNIFNEESQTIIFNDSINEIRNHLHFIKVNFNNLVPEILENLHRLSMQSVLVEGGAKTLQSFIDMGLWDEALSITNPNLVINKGVESPKPQHMILKREEMLGNDILCYYSNSKSN